MCKVFIQKIAPQRLLSMLAGKLANCKCSVLKKIFIKSFLFKYKLNMDEAIEGNPYAYESFNALFTRQLKSNVRPIVQDKAKIISPADGTVAQIGSLQQSLILKVKGKEFHLAELLGGDVIDVANFIDGSFATIYLAPTDYHRVHMPLAGTLEQMLYVPGKLFSVNKATATAIPNLFGRNERVINVFDTEHGKMVVILVGAMLVGHIYTHWAGIVNAKHEKTMLHKTYTDAVQKTNLSKGDEIGYFQMGSTAIVLLEKGKVDWQPALQVDSKVKVGEALGELK